MISSSVISLTKLDESNHTPRFVVKATKNARATTTIAKLKDTESYTDYLSFPQNFLVANRRGSRIVGPDTLTFGTSHVKIRKSGPPLTCLGRRTDFIQLQEPL